MNDRHHWQRIALLVLLAGLVQSWMVYRNPVPAQDAVAFIQFARELAHYPLVETARRHPQHPLFPTLVCWHHQLFGPIMSQDGFAWIRSAQWVAGLAAVFSIVPMYLAGVRLGGSTLATGAAVLFSVLPCTARLGADALSDSTHLLFLLVGFWACTEYLTPCGSGTQEGSLLANSDGPLVRLTASRRRARERDNAGTVTHAWGLRLNESCPRWLLLAGSSVGVAYLARLEALLLPVALVLTLAVLQLRPLWRLPWKTVLAGVTCLGLGMLAVAGPYVITVGKLTPKGSLILLPGGRLLASWATPAAAGGLHSTLFNADQVLAPHSEPVPLPAMPEGKLNFDAIHRSPQARLEGYGPAASELFRELIEGLHYIPALLVLVGLCRSPRQPANLLATLLALVFAGVLVQFASKAGYLAGRHVIPLVCLGAYVAARGGWTLAVGVHALACFLQAKAWTPTWRLRLAGALLVAAVVLCLGRDAVLLHESRDPHVRAGRWLAAHASAGSIVLDTRGWAALCSGLPSYICDNTLRAFEDSRLAYVVVEKQELQDVRPRSQTLRHLLGIGGQKVVEFDGATGPNGSVEVYRWNSERVAQAAGNGGPSLRAN